MMFTEIFCPTLGLPMWLVFFSFLFVLYQCRKLFFPTIKGRISLNNNDIEVKTIILAVIELCLSDY